jgi:biopolymer transport protein ExbD
MGSMGLDEGINLTPLIDVLFNLIFFFILATTIKSREAYLAVTLPESEQAVAAAQSDQSTWVIVMGEDQALYLNEEPVDEATLTERLTNVSPEEISGLVIRGDAKAWHGTLVKVLDACARAGHTEISIQTLPLHASTPPTPTGPGQ